MRRILLVSVVYLIVSVTVFAQDNNQDTIEIENISEILTIDGEGAILQVAWSPVDDRFAVVRQLPNYDVVEIWKFEADSHVTLVTEIRPESVAEIHWLPDGQSLVTHGKLYTDSQIHFLVESWDTETSGRNDVFLNNFVDRPDREVFKPLIPPIFAWNSNYQDFANSEGTLSFTLSNGQQFSLDMDESLWIRQVLWSTDDRYIAVVYGSGDTYEIQLLEANSLETLTLIGGMDYLVSHMAWSPDSSKLAVASVWSNPYSPSENVRIYDIDEPLYGEVDTVFSADIPEGSKNHSAGLAWSPDSGILGISFPESIEFYDPETFTKLLQLDIEGVTSLDWHHSGELILGGDVDGTIRIWGIPAKE